MNRQTAFAAVSVFPELDDELVVDIDWDKDVREDRLRSGGAGGQHVNKTESAIRLTQIRNMAEIWWMTLVARASCRITRDYLRNFDEQKNAKATTKNHGPRFP